MFRKKSIKILAAIFSVFMLTSLVGCNNSANTTKTSGNEKKIGGIVRTSISSEPDNFDPYLSAASDTGAIMNNVFEGLMGFTDTGAIVPVLAEKYTVSEDGLKYTFNLRKNVKFHDGSAFNAADVKYCFEKLSGLSGQKALSSKFTKLTKIEAKDDYTIEMTLKAKDAAFLANCIVPIVPSDYNNESQKPIGTGPFKFVEYVAGQKVVLEKNKDYYNEAKKANIDKAEIRIMTDPNSVVMALKSGDLDMALVETKDVAGLKDNFDIYQAPQNMVQLFALNNSREPLNNLKVRQAINYAIDKDAIIKTVAEGSGTKLFSNMSPAMKLYYADGLDKYKTDINKAKQLLKEAGYENGFTTTVTVPSNYKFHVDTAQVIADQLAKVNIKLQIKQVEWAKWLDQVYSKADYDSTVIGLTGKLDPNEILVRYESKYAKNFYKFSNPQYDELIAKAASETDGNKRVEYYKECQKMLTDNAVAVYIMDPSSNTAAKKNLKGIKSYPVTNLDLASLYYTK